MISRLPTTFLAEGKEICLLYSGQKTERARSVEYAFVRQGYTVNWLTLRENAPSNQPMVSLLDLDDPFFDNLSEQSFLDFQEFVSEKSPESILWITYAAQAQCVDPRWGLVFGIARTIRWEFNLPFATFETTTFDSKSADLLVKVHEKFQTSLASGVLPDYEYSTSADTVATPRYYPTKLTVHDQEKTSSSVPKKLQMGTFGLLDSVQWLPDEGIRSPGPGEVQVDIRYVGLNFRVKVKTSSPMSLRTNLS